LNHGIPDAFNTEPAFPRLPLTGHIADMAKSTKMTHGGHSACFRHCSMTICPSFRL
jgi:hypothetical protein